jgi:preprotein translocase subunit SecG
MGFLQYLLMIVLFLLAIFLIILILIQRGRGGGLAGAFGGLGGQSAFGTKAGDVFTKVTVIMATAWIVLCIVSIKVLSASSGPLNLATPSQGEQQGQPGEPTGKGGAPEPGSSAPSGPQDGSGEQAPSSPGTSPGSTPKK